MNNGVNNTNGVYPNNNVNQLNQNMQPQNNNFVNNQNMNYQYPNNQMNYNNFNKKKNVGKIILIIIAIVFGFFLIVGLTNIFSEKYIFSDENNIVDDENGSINNSTNTDLSNPNKNETKVVYDNIYENIPIVKTSDAYNLIIKDSVQQKDKCPTEIKKVEEKIMKDFSITAVNLCELDLDFANELYNVFKKVYDEYPSARGLLTNFTLVNAKENYIAAYIPASPFANIDSVNIDDLKYPEVLKMQVVLNARYFLNISRLRKEVEMSSKLGHFPKNVTAYSPVAHELGHYLSFFATLKHYKTNSILLLNRNNYEQTINVINDYGYNEYPLKMIKEAYEKYKKDTNDNIEFDKWRGTISQYALAKNDNGEYIYDETIAESFHDVYLNGDNAVTASKYVVAVLKKNVEG